MQERPHAGPLFLQGEWTDKPGSVVGRPFISNARHRASLARNPNARKGGRIAFLFAFAPDGVCQATSLPTHWCAFTAPFQLFSCSALAAHRFARPSSFPGELRAPCRGVFFSVALSVGSPRPAVSWHLALGSPDFPRTLRERTRPSSSLAYGILTNYAWPSSAFCRELPQGHFR